MKNIIKQISDIEKKSFKGIIKIILLSFGVSFIIGFSTGLFVREIQLSMLETKVKAQRIREDKEIHQLFGKFININPSPKTK